VSVAWHLQREPKRGGAHAGVWRNTASMRALRAPALAPGVLRCGVLCDLRGMSFQSGRLAPS
jgi:hypothetical protein